MERAKDFYINVMGQKLLYDFGENIQLECGISIQLRDHYANMIGVEPSTVIARSNSGELYFEEDNLEEFEKKLDDYGTEFLKRLEAHPWGQRAMCFYDPDGNIIEVGESLEFVVRRFLKSGMSAEETSEVSQMPIEFVREQEKMI